MGGTATGGHLVGRERAVSGNSAVPGAAATLGLATIAATSASGDGGGITKRDDVITARMALSSTLVAGQVAARRPDCLTAGSAIRSLAAL